MNATSSAMEGLKWRLIGVAGKALVDGICRSLRTEVMGLDAVREIMASRRFILAFWHSRIVLVSYLFQGWNAACLVSASQDGEIMAQVVKRQGHETIRGSSSRHGVRALSRLIKTLKEQNRPAAVVPDGPQGPRFHVQTGVITLAQRTGYPIVPVSYSAKRVKVFASWDRFILPCPFTAATVLYGQPVSVPANVSDADREHFRLELEDELNRITRALDRRYGLQIG